MGTIEKRNFQHPQVKSALTSSSDSKIARELLGIAKLTAQEALLQSKSQPNGLDESEASLPGKRSQTRAAGLAVGCVSADNYYQRRICAVG